VAASCAVGRTRLSLAGVAGHLLPTSPALRHPSAVRRRYRRAQRAASLRPLRFHDLRHSFGSLVIREFDPVAVKDFMGHAKITTTERYLHARSRRTDAARLTKAFAGAEHELAAVE
jgi:integrase